MVQKATLILKLSSRYKDKVEIAFMKILLLLNNYNSDQLPLKGIEAYIRRFVKIDITEHAHCPCLEIVHAKVSSHSTRD